MGPFIQFSLKRGEHYRSIASIQRRDRSLEESVLHLNEDTGLVELAGSKKEVDTALKGEEILAFLEEQEEPVHMVTIQAELKCRRKPLNDTLRTLVERGKLSARGAEKGVTCTTILLFPRVPKKRRLRQHAGNSNCSVIPKG